jgi:hypothetical protein
MSEDVFGDYDGDYGDFNWNEWVIEGDPFTWTAEERVLLNLPEISDDEPKNFDKLSLNDEKQSIVDLVSDEEDSDDAINEFCLQSFLRFRQVFVASKQQLKAMTFDRFQALLQETQNVASHSMSGRDYEPHLQLTEAHLNAFRTSQTPGFPATFFFPPTPKTSEISETVTVGLLSHASTSTVPTVLTSSPCPPVALETVTVKPLLFLPHASVTPATVPASTTSQPPLSSVKVSSGPRRRRHRGKGSHAR